MKVAYNACFGGFGLSPVALTEFAERKGVTLTWYEQTGYRHNNTEEYKLVEGVPQSNHVNFTPLTVNLGKVIKSLPGDSFYHPNFDDIRSDSDLIEVIEELGDRANGTCAELAITEIPDGVEYEITYYDGNESVVPPRPSW